MGNGAVILDRVEYDKGLFKIINDTTKFRVLTSDPTLTREGKLQRYLRELRKKGHFDPDVYETIYPSGSQPARIYRLPKMHKPRAPNSTPPFRPIVSSIGTYNYSLAKYLSNLLQPHIPSTFIASDSFTFVKEINDLSLHGMFMVSFDVESLFTNIPLDDCINLAVKYITEGNPGLKLIVKMSSKGCLSLLPRKLTSCSRVTSMIRWMVLPWDPPLPLFSPISLRVTMRIYG